LGQHIHMIKNVEILGPRISGVTEFRQRLCYIVFGVDRVEFELHLQVEPFCLKMYIGSFYLTPKGL
jgi:hypothetical protein